MDLERRQCGSHHDVEEQHRTEDNRANKEKKNQVKN